MLLARQLNRQLDGALPVIAWSPGLVIPRGDGGFFRHNRQSNPLGMALFAFAARDLLRLTESVATAGQLLADLVVGEPGSSPGFSYFSNQLVRPGRHCFGPADTSPEAADLAKAEQLWGFSEVLISSVLER